MNGLKKLFKNRITYLGIFLIAVMACLLLRLFTIQVLNGEEYKEEANRYREYSLLIDAPRGNIYDRNGVLIAGNRKAYKVYMINTNDDQKYRDRMYLDLISTFEKNGDQYQNYLSGYITFPLAWGELIDEPSEISNKQAFMNEVVRTKSDRKYFETPVSAFNYLRSEVFDISEEYTDSEAYKIMVLRYQTYVYGLDTLRPSLVGLDVCKETVDEITSKSIDFNGVTTEETYFRYYVNNLSAGPVTGYVRAIDEEEYEEKKDLGYLPNDVIGKMGIEKTYEEELRGKRGYRTYIKLSDGTVAETGYEPPVPGNDVYLTIDIKLQERLYQSLKAAIADTVARSVVEQDNFGDCRAGAAVVSDVNSGEILAMVSYPGFDSNVFVAPQSDKKALEEIKKILESKDSPSINRCTQGTYPIGSMIKPIIAIAALDREVTDSERTVNCPGYIIVSGKKMKCLSVHKDLNLVQALGRSCNVYFSTVGIEAGIDSIDYWAKQFGLGEYSGVEIPEKKGFRSNPATMDIFEEGRFHKWNDASTAATCIGQLYTTFTPIQVNRYTAAISNGGTLYEMHLLKSITDSRGSLLFEKEAKGVHTGVKQEIIDLVKEAMTKMVDAYPAIRRQAADYPKYFLAGKTGTAQAGTNEESSHGFYTGYFPCNDPQIALTLMLEHGVYSGNAFPMIGDILDFCFEGSYTEGDRTLIHAYDRYSTPTGSGQRLGKWFDRRDPVN